jgi:NADPH:quinone reductase-like Zn-dependent oxidoreductase
MLESLSPEQWKRSGDHAERGRLTVVDLARHMAAHDTGMCSEEKSPVVRSVGAEEVLDYRKVDLATCPPTYDVILDASGKASFSRSQSALKPGGFFVAVLPSLSLALEALPKLGRKRISFPMTALRSPKALLTDLNLLVDLARSEKIVHIISRHFSIEETPDAHRFN